MTEWLHFHFSLSCIGEGNGNQLQYSCLENPRDGGVWWAAIYGVAQSRTRLKRLSSSGGSLQWQRESGCMFAFEQCSWHFSQELISIRRIHSTLAFPLRSLLDTKHRISHCLRVGVKNNSWIPNSPIINKLWERNLFLKWRQSVYYSCWLEQLKF